ncbi:MAG TPA: hypothetical protein VIO58_08215 [Candidatus Methanoperedens sp.]
MRKLLMLALLVPILMGAMLPAIGLGDNNAIITQTQVATASRDNNAVVTQTQIAMVSGGNNVDQYTDTTVIPEFEPDIWCKRYNTVIRKVLVVRHIDYDGCRIIKYANPEASLIKTIMVDY